MDTQRVPHLLDKRDEIDRELAEIITGISKKSLRCSACGEEGHTARTCTRKQPAPPPQTVLENSVAA